MDHVKKMRESLKAYTRIEQPSAATLQQRSDLMRQMMIDLTFFENVPPCDDADKIECVLARKFIPFVFYFCGLFR